MTIEKELPKHIEKWKKIYFSTEQTDRDLGEKALRKLYEEAGHKTPKILWCSSPLAAAMAYTMAMKKATVKELHVLDEETALENACKAVSAVTPGPCISWDVQHERFRKSLHYLHGEKQYKQEWNNFWVKFTGEVSGQHGITRNLEHSQDNVQPELAAAYKQMIWGQHMSPWVGIAELMVEYAPLNELKKQLCGALTEIANHVGWVLPTEDYCFVSDKTTVLSRDDQKRLHNDVGPAVGYADGTGLYYHHNFLVPKKVIMAPETLTVKEIDSERNAEIRRIMMEKFGWQNYMEAAGGELIDQYIDQMDFPVRLFKKDLGNQFEVLCMIEFTNSSLEGDGTRRKYMFAVPPTIRSAREAHAWHCGLEAKEIEFVAQA